MSRLNPLYLILLAFTLFFISFFVLNEEKRLFNELSIDVNSIKSKALSYKDYKSTWSSKAYAQSTIERILNSNPVKKARVLKTVSNKILKVKVESRDTKVLNSFLNKVLNKNLKINKLEINKAYIYLEVGL